MKNQYMIVKHTPENGTLYYNDDHKIFTCVPAHAEKYTNKKTAEAAAKYASKYASGCELPGEIEIIKL